MHIPPHDNRNEPIVAPDNECVPLTYFNIVKLREGESFEYSVPGYETCIVPATGTIDVSVGDFSFQQLGNRGRNVWDGEPEGVYAPTGATAILTCRSKQTEVFVAGARYGEVLEPFDVRGDQLDVVQYGSDETKTHR